MAASDHLNDEQFTMMRPSELLPYARDRSDKFGRVKVQGLAASIQKNGYRARLAKGNKAPITLDHTGPWPELTEGNHRVHAMNSIGYDRPVRVKVKR